MGTTVTLDPAALSVEPGGEAVCRVVIRNTGTVVDQFTVEIVGAPSGWASPEPPSVSLFPATEEAVTLHFRPPRSASTTAGTVPFGVRVISREDAGGSVVEEGVVDVAPFRDLFAELIPRVARGRRSARQRLALDNRGNTLANTSLSGVDAQEALRFDFKPAGIVAAPGVAEFGTIRVRPKKRFLRGSPKTHTYQVLALSDGDAPVTADGSLVQDALIPRWLPLVLAALAALALLWLFLLKPAVESAAENAVRDPLQQQQGQIRQLAGSVGDIAKRVGAPVPTLAPEAGAAAGVGLGGTPFDRRLAVTDAPGDREASQQLPAVAAKTTLSLTDVLLENPLGGTGFLQLQRNGKDLITIRLENFRDLDYHFVTPLVFKTKDVLRLVLTCDSVNPPATSCSAAAYVVGFTNTTTV